MKTIKFTIPLYHVDVQIVQLEGKKDKKPLAELFKKSGIEDDEALENIDKQYGDGGYTYRNFGKNDIVIVLYPFTNKESKTSVYFHEKRHVEDRVLEHCSVNDIEAAAYLAGFLAVKFMELYEKVKVCKNPYK